MKYNFDKMQIMVAEKIERCQGYGCYNKILPEQIFTMVSTEFVKDNENIKQRLCVKCFQKYLIAHRKLLEKQITDINNNLGKMEMLADKYYGGF